MKYLYLVRRTDRVDYDQYDSFVVVAKTPKKAKDIHPSPFSTWTNDNYGSWVKTKDKDTLIGMAEDSLEEGTVILSSFNAG